MRYKQSGASYLGMFIIIVLAAFALKMAVALFPAFWDDRIINKEIVASLQGLSKDATQSQFKSDLSKRLDLNNIRDLKAEDIVQVDSVSGLKVKKDYEVRAPFIANVALVMTFQKDFDQNTLNKTGNE